MSDSDSTSVEGADADGIRPSATGGKSGRSRASRRMPLWLSIFLALISAAALVLLTITMPATADAAVPVDLDGRPVRLEQSVESSAVAVADSVISQVSVDDSTEIADIGDWLVIASVGLDVPLGSLVESDGVIEPQGFTSAYLVRNRGVSPERAEAGTVYVVMHAVQGGRAPGNYLVDPETGDIADLTGSHVVIAHRDYLVTGVETIAKSDLANRADIWRGISGRLVLITCLPEGSGYSSDNVVVTAELIDSSSS